MNVLRDGITVPVEADISGFSEAMKDLESESKRFGTAFSSTIKSAISQGKSFEDTLKALALRFSDIALSAGLKPLENLATSAFQSVLGNLIGGTGGRIPITPFAKGGVVNSATFFGAGGSIGVMGEAGAEAILPLARGADGKLGVRSDGNSVPVNVTFNISTPDVAGFKRSQGQISGLLARTVQRGNRVL